MCAGDVSAIDFSGYRWIVKSAPCCRPGPNRFDERNVRVLPSGDLALDLRERDGQWTCAELQTAERLGFGTYQIQLIGRPDEFDPNHVFGFFQFPTGDVGPDGTHEIDIEFARWGNRDNPCANFTIWPPDSKVPGTNVTHPFSMRLEGDYTTHRIVRRADGIVFSSHHGHRDLGDPRGLMDAWEFRGAVSQAPMPLHLNLWLFKGAAPQSGRSAHVAIRDLQFVPRRP